MSDYFDLKIGSRFIFVNLLPTTAFAALVGGLISAGAPRHAPAWRTLDATVRHVGVLAGLLIAGGVMITAVALHPLSYLIIQMLEGYWDRLPGGLAARKRVGRKYDRWRYRLQSELSGENQSRVKAELGWLPNIEAPVLPTRLGNTLVAGEVRAGQRYGYDTAALLPRLVPLLSPTLKDELTDARNQLDTAARLSVLGMFATPVTLVLLWRHATWLLVPLGCYLFAWMAYNAAIAAAQRFCEALSVAVDYHRLQVWESMSLPRPRNVYEERAHRGLLLTRLLTDGQVFRQDLEELSFTGSDDSVKHEPSTGEGEMVLPKGDRGPARLIRLIRGCRPR